MPRWRASSALRPCSKAASVGRASAFASPRNSSRRRAIHTCGRRLMTGSSATSCSAGRHRAVSVWRNCVFALLVSRRTRDARTRKSSSARGDARAHANARRTSCIYLDGSLSTFYTDDTATGISYTAGHCRSIRAMRARGLVWRARIQIRRTTAGRRSAQPSRLRALLPCKRSSSSLSWQRRIPNCAGYRCVTNGTCMAPRVLQARAGVVRQRSQHLHCCVGARRQLGAEEEGDVGPPRGHTDPLSYTRTATSRFDV